MRKEARGHRNARSRHCPLGGIEGGRHCWVVLGVLVLAGLAPAAPAPAQDDDIERRGIFIDTLDVTLINVEVRVTTKDGTMVEDLALEDFEILDDGEPVEITHFYRVESGKRIQAPTDEDAASPADQEEALPAAPQEERSSVIVLVDQSFLSLSSRKQAFEALKRQLDVLMSDGTQVMVVSKATEIEVAQYATSDRVEIDAALDRLAKKTLRSRSMAERLLIRDMQRVEAPASDGFGALAGPGGGGGSNDSVPLGIDPVEIQARQTLSQARNHSEMTLAEVRRSVRLLRQFLASLAGLPGRKAVIYVADEMPIQPGEVAWRVWWQRFGEQYGRDFGVSSAESMLMQYDASKLVNEMIAEANANRVAFYPVGTGRDTLADATSAENASLPTGSTASILQLNNANSGLLWLASGTGGRAALGRSQTPKFFHQMREDLTHYYSLAYPSPHQGDGETHDLKVRVKNRPELRVRYLDSYRDKSGEQQMTERTLAAVLLGVADNPLDVRVVIGDSEKNDKGGTFVVPIEVRFPLSNLVLLPEKKAHVGKVSIHIVVRDEKGRMSDPVKIPLPIEIPHEQILQALSQNAVYTTRLTMRGGSQTIAIGVHDDVGSTSSTVNMDIHVGREGRG